MVQHQHSSLDCRPDACALCGLVPASLGIDQLMIGGSSISNRSEYDITFSSHQQHFPRDPCFWRRASRVSASAMRTAHSRVICASLSHSAHRIRPGTVKAGVDDSMGAKVRSGVQVNLSLSPTATTESSTSLQTIDESHNGHSCLTNSTRLQARRTENRIDIRQEPQSVGRRYEGSPWIMDRGRGAFFNLCQTTVISDEPTSLFGCSVSACEATAQMKTWRFPGPSSLSRYLSPRLAGRRRMWLSNTQAPVNFEGLNKPCRACWGGSLGQGGNVSPPLSVSWVERQRLG